MSNLLEDVFLTSKKIRLFEESLLELFSKGGIGGTTHTCIGQEVGLVSIIQSLPSYAVIFSNHRSHGHFLAHRNSYEPLLKEILGSSEGVNSGIGGSQHLCVPGKFYSNGVLGGTLAMACGFAWGLQSRGVSENLSVAFMGDGAIGEGICYESFNMAKLRKLPVLFVVERNDIAQSTPTKLTQSGTIEDRFRAFDIPVMTVDCLSVEKIRDTVLYLLSIITENNGPAALVLHTPRLGPHSKGDDTRTPDEISKLVDPLKLLEQKIAPEVINQLLEQSKTEIEQVYSDTKPTKDHRGVQLNYYKNWYADTEFNSQLFDVLTNQEFSVSSFASRVNSVILNMMALDDRIVFIGEDVADPYGGAFKISKGLSTNFSSRVWSTPISEQAITGYSGGASLSGSLPIAEIMFGDFITLAADGLVNYFSKFRLMYGMSVSTPGLIRTAVGGGRGYGPTHSQSLERMFCGIPGLFIEASSPIFDLRMLYARTLCRPYPTLMVESKTDYSTTFAPEDPHNLFSGFNYSSVKSASEEIITASFSPLQKSDLVIVAYGGMIKEALKACKNLLIDYELLVDVVAFHRIQPVSDCIDELRGYKQIFLLEEGGSTFGVMSEYALRVKEKNPESLVYRISGLDNIIPNSTSLEHNVVLGSGAIEKFIIKNIGYL